MLKTKGRGLEVKGALLTDIYVYFKVVPIVMNFSVCLLAFVQL